MKEFEIRRLIENYYDIQKIRVETFNRIVNWVKENKDRIEETLSQYILENQDKNASYKRLETQSINASQRETGIQMNGASHFNHESQEDIASHTENETHRVIASQLSIEIQIKNAVKLLKNKKYSEFVKKFILSQEIIEIQEKNVSHSKHVPHGCFAFSNLLKEIENLIWFHNKLYETEKGLYSRIDEWSKDHPLRKEFLNYVKGIGPIFSSGIIAWFCNPILKAKYVSQIWSYCGLAPGKERKKGKKLSYNPKLKTFCWKIGQSFIKFKCFGRKLYLSFKKECEQKHPDWSKLHIHNWARRKVVKLFIAAVWEVWRKMNNLPVTKPYPIEVLGHKDIITPEKWIEKQAS